MENHISTLQEQYSFAVIRLVLWAPYDPKQEKRDPLKLVFASVTLMTNERYPPSRPKNATACRIPGKGTLHYDRLIMKVESAIKWYRCESDSIKTPIPEQDGRGCDGIQIAETVLEDFPVWPKFGVPIATDDLLSQDLEAPEIPFKTPTIARYHRRLSSHEDWSIAEKDSLGNQILGSDDALSFLKRYCHVDFYDYPEYFGSMNLILTDPKIRSIKQFVVPLGNNRERLVIQVIPRPNTSAEGISLTQLTTQNGMLTACNSTEVPTDGVVSFEFDGPVQLSGLVLTHPELGVLAQTPMTPFMRSIGFSMEVARETTKISAPSSDRKNSSLTHYTTTKTSTASESTIGSKSIHDSVPLQRINEARLTRKLRRDATRSEQTWFSSGEREKALEMMRAKIRGARHTVVIADPYFSYLQVSQLLYAIQRDHVNINILTSKEAFKRSHFGCSPCKEKASNVRKKIDELSMQIDKFKAHNQNRIEVYVSTDIQNTIHDRFLIVDGKAWLLGSSLNSMGHRPTMILRVPYPHLINEEINEAIDTAISLNDYKKQR